MKKTFRYSLFALVAICALTVFAVSCQQKEAPAQPPAPAEPAPAPMAFATQNSVKLFMDNEIDTLLTTSSLDTVDYNVGRFSIPVSVQVQITADSISGSTGATCYLQTRLRTSGADKYWIDVPSATAVINGVQTRAQITSTTLVTGDVRCRCLAPSSTQRTYVYWKGYVTEKAI